MAKYAKGKKSLAISDVSGLRVPYTQLKTTWDGLRVSPEDFDPKQPQLTPAKNVVDATALFNPRPDTDPENVVVFIGYTQDWTIDRRLRPGVGVSAPGFIGNIGLEVIHTVTGVGGTANVGTVEATIQTEIIAQGQAGDGEVGPNVAAVQTLTVTVQSVGGANKYFIGGVQQDTLELMESRTYYFDQSASSNSGHPLRFSTTANGTHAGGSEYTTGVTTSGTPGSSGAYTQIVVAENAPTLYYYCTQHSGMGGQANTPVFSSILIEIEDIIGGVGGSGDPGTVNVNALPPITGVGGTGGVGTEAFLLEATPSGVGGAANVGSVDVNNLLSVSGVSGSGNIGIANIEDPLGWGIGPWGLGPFGDDAGRPPAIGQAGSGGTGTVTISADMSVTGTGSGGTGNVGDESIELDYTGFGSNGFSEGTWGQ